MKEIGEYLQETRVNHGVSVEEAAEDLSITSRELENIEGGNTRAFKDIYQLKDLVHNYAKYLGLDPEKVMDEFNDFLFEKTSKISLQDILEAKNIKKEEEPKKKISSPYTNIPIQKKNYGPIVLTVLVFMFIILILYLIAQSRIKSDDRTHELSGVRYFTEEVCA